MNVLIVGGAGFIGSNLAMMLQKGNSVTVFDDFSLGSMENLAGFEGKIIKGDVTNLKALKKAAKESRAEQIYHLAAHSSSEMFNFPKQATKVNVIGTLNVFEVAKEFKIKRVVYASTSTLYADRQEDTREDRAVVPQNMYAATKLMNEMHGKIYAHQNLVETVGVRFFSCYGPNEKPKGKYANFLTQFLIGMRKGEQPVVYGDGKQTRDFIFVRDLCRGMVLAMNTEGISGEIINLGTGVQTNIIDLVTLLNRALGKDIKPRFEPNPIKGYVTFHKADIGKATSLLEWKPEYTLEKGLKEMLEAYK